MSRTFSGAIVHPAIKEIIHLWFAFFEGLTVPASRQLDIFENDIQLVHTGQHMPAPLFVTTRW